MKCYVCGKSTGSRKRYCPHCRKFLVKGSGDRLKRRAAMREAYDRDADAFRCHYSRVVLEEHDLSSPFHFCFDHYVPVRTSHLVLTTDLLNSMKNELSEQELRDAVDELLLHRDGKPFDTGRIPFRHWTKRAPALPDPGPRLCKGEVSNVLVDACVVCGAPPRRWSYYCDRCRRLATYRSRVRRERAMALKAAWSEEEDGFLCAYTGVRVDEEDAGSPWAFCIDHAIPGDEDTLVVSSYWANAMKTALTKDEFYIVLEELKACWGEGKEFDKDIASFDYWRNKPRR